MKKALFPFLCFCVLMVACRAPQSVTPDRSTERTAKNMLDTLQRLKASGLIVDGMVEKLRGNFEGAVNNFEKCLRVDPNNSAAYYHLSGLYDMQGRMLVAQDFARKAVELEPKNEWYMLQLAYLYQRNASPKEAALTFEKLIKLNPEKVDYYFPYSDALLLSGQSEKAIDALQKLEKLYGFNENVVIQKYRIYAQLRQFDKARLEIEKLIKVNPYEVRNYGIIAELYEEQGKTEKAMEYYQKILEIEPGNGVVHLSLAQHYYHTGEKEKSFEALKKAFASPALDIDTKMKILLDYYDRSENDPSLLSEAYALLDILLEVHPSEAKAYSIYGDFLIRDGKEKEAREMFYKALEQDSSVYLIWNQVMLLNSQLNDLDALYRDGKKAATLFPAQPVFFYFYGVGAFSTKHYEEARDALLSGKDLVIDNKALLFEFYQLLGDTYHQLKDDEKSDSYYEKALAIDPTSVYVLNNYAYYLSVRKIKLEKAAEMSKKSNELSPGQSSFQDTYGWILFQMKKYTEAETWLRKALDSGGNSSGVILEHYGDVLFMLGKPNEAVEYWKKAKEAGDSSPQIDRKIKEKKYYE